MTNEPFLNTVYKTNLYRKALSWYIGSKIETPLHWTVLLNLVSSQIWHYWQSEQSMGNETWLLHSSLSIHSAHLLLRDFWKANSISQCRGCPSNSWNMTAGMERGFPILTFYEYNKIKDSLDLGQTQVDYSFGVLWPKFLWWQDITEIMQVFPRILPRSSKCLSFLSVVLRKLSSSADPESHCTDVYQWKQYQTLQKMKCFFCLTPVRVWEMMSRKKRQAKTCE